MDVFGESDNTEPLKDWTSLQNLVLHVVQVHISVFIIQCQRLKHHCKTHIVGLELRYLLRSRLGDKLNEDFALFVA